MENPVEIVNEKRGKPKNGLARIEPPAITASFMGGQVHVALTGLEVDKLEKMMEMEFRWQANEANRSYQEAMAAFKSEVPAILKNKTALFDSKRTNSQVSYDYATLDNVCEKLIPALSKHGLTHKWRTEQKDGKIRVTCILSKGIHSEEVATLEAMPDDTGSKNSIQAIGSTTSYLERYTFLAACGVAVKGMDTDSKPEMEGLQTHLNAIMEAPNLMALETAYRTAAKEAMAKGEVNALRTIVLAKDARKDLLTRDEPAQ